MTGSALIPFKRIQSNDWSNPLYGVAKGSLYEVVSLLVMIGKRGHLVREAYREHYREVDEIAAMIVGAIRSTRSG